MDTELMHELRMLPAQVKNARANWYEAQKTWMKHRFGTLADCQRQAETATLHATATAPQDGKNAEQRKMQLELWLLESKDVQVAQAALRQAERSAFDFENAANAAETEYRYQRDRLQVALAVARLVTAEQEDA
jgi:hypothetical protein